MSKIKKLNPEAIGLIMIIVAAFSASIYQPYSQILTGDNFSIYLFGMFAFLGSTVFCLILFITQFFLTMKDKEKRNYLHGFKEYLYTFLSGISSVGANLFLLTAMRFARASEVSLITNLEVVVTMMFAKFLFRQKVAFYNWFAAPLIVSGAILLTFDFSADTIKFSYGLLFALGSCICWPLENNFSQLVSHRNPVQITGIKHCISFVVDMIFAFSLGHRVTQFKGPLEAFGIGAFSLGFVFILYVLAQKRIGAARASALYSLAPFLGSFIYLLVTKTVPQWNFYLGASLIFSGQLLIIVMTLRNSKKESEEKKKADTVKEEGS